MGSGRKQICLFLPVVDGGDFVDGRHANQIAHLRLFGVLLAVILSRRLSKHWKKAFQTFCTNTQGDDDRVLTGLYALGKYGASTITKKSSLLVYPLSYSCFGHVIHWRSSVLKAYDGVLCLPRRTVKSVTISEEIFLG